MGALGPCSAPTSRRATGWSRSRCSASTSSRSRRRRSRTNWRRHRSGAVSSVHRRARSRRASRAPSRIEPRNTWRPSRSTSPCGITPPRRWTRYCRSFHSSPPPWTSRGWRGSAMARSTRATSLSPPKKRVRPDSGWLKRSASGAARTRPAAVFGARARGRGAVEHTRDVFSLSAIAYELLTGHRPAGTGADIGDAQRPRPVRHAPAFYTACSHGRWIRSPARRYPAGRWHSPAALWKTAARGSSVTPVVVSMASASPAVPIEDKVGSDSARRNGEHSAGSRAPGKINSPAAAAPSSRNRHGRARRRSSTTAATRRPRCAIVATRGSERPRRSISTSRSLNFSARREPSPSRRKLKGVASIARPNATPVPPIKAEPIAPRVRRPSR